jgi:hypothetical protein
VSIGAIVINLRMRTTRKGDRMAWLTLADAPNGESPLREGAFFWLPVTG